MLNVSHFYFLSPAGCGAERALRQQVILSPLRMMTRAVLKLRLAVPASDSVAGTKKICPVNRPSTNLQNLVLLSLGNLHENQNNGHMPTQVSSLRLSLGSSMAARALWDSLDCRQFVLLSWPHSLAALTLSLVASTDLLGELIGRFCQNTLFSKKNGSTAMSEAIFWYRI